MTALAIAITFSAALGAGTALDERPAGPGEWGFRPEAGAICERTPPPFSWRPQKGARSYELQASRDQTFARIDYAADEIEWSVHCPPRAFEPGEWVWRFRFIDDQGAASAWSASRSFTVADDARTFTLPACEELIARIPAEHPRLFLRPDDVPRLREAAAGPRAKSFQALVARCERWIETPPPTEEPPKYDADMVRGSDPWRAIWWGNRTYTIRVLEAAETLAFVWRLEGREDCGALARKILMECAAWDPKGSTGYRYNDEAGMPYAYHFSRAYTLIHPLLTEDERVRCRKIMRTRGREMYAHLAPSHLWKPYSSHSNRAWHFLGEVGVAFHGEIPEADDWTWFAANVFATVYPVWSDADGGWHEGTAYWKSYLARFTWWADVQKAALGLDAYQLPFFSRTGDWAMYLMPPGTRGGGFGDQNAARTSAENRALMTTLALQSGDPRWRWYVEQLGGPDFGDDWIGFLREAAPDVVPAPPTDLPTSRAFRGVGVAVLQSSLESASDNVEVIFKSSPFGSQSHGYEAQNAFLLYAYGERLLIRSGKRDSYGSTHHRKWMWETKSTNDVTVDGHGQTPHAATARGRITAFHTEPGVHYVEGEAGDAYGGRLDGFRRGILFLEPDLIVIIDRLRAKDPARFDWHLHSESPFEPCGDAFTTTSGAAACRIELIRPDAVTWSQTDRFDPPPRERVKLIEHHLTATAADTDQAMFLAVIRPYRAGDAAPASTRVERSGSDTVRLIAELDDARATIDVAADGTIHATVVGPDGAVSRALHTAELGD